MVEEKDKHGREQGLITGHAKLWRIAVLLRLYAAKTTFCLENIKRHVRVSLRVAVCDICSVLESCCRKLASKV